MEKIRYLQLRNANDHMVLLYEYAKEKGFNHSFNNFQVFLTMWTHQLMFPVDINSIVQQILDEYDVKFGLTLLQEIMKDGSTKTIKVM